MGGRYVMYIQSEKDLDVIIRIVENFKPSNNDDETKKIIVFFPEFEEVIRRSILFGEMNRNALRRNLNFLYVKKFRQDRLDYITSLKKTLETEQGRKYLKEILPS